ncbi:MAG: glutamate--cysteine ligase [Pirellulales bacterium]|nr:glutamate--cysteine ligase [Pirellulales bacterium]
MTIAAPLSLFTAFGIELEYMIVDARTLDVRPIADELIRAATGEITSETDQGGISWSNELVLHVVELKTTDPATSLDGWGDQFARHVTRMNGLLAPLGARLMPTAMHPWMDPAREMRLWPHDYGDVYAAFDRIFGCQGHGWANLQSMHINLPFSGDEEFGKLHAAIRLLLPILPALAASSPLVERRATGKLDTRLDVYRTNSRRIPSITGHVVPEAVFTQRDYEEKILERIYRDIAPLDPDETLQDEWLNARGAIARFCRGTIEIRVLDVQECPKADLAIATATVAVLKALVEERWSDLASQQKAPTEPLAEILQATTIAADQAVIENEEYLQLFSYPGKRATARELWAHLIESLPELSGSNARPETRKALEVIQKEGPLARRILRALGVSNLHQSSEFSTHQLAEVYARLCDSLTRNELLS